jgi:hypothetical protein
MHRRAIAIGKEARGKGINVQSGTGVILLPEDGAYRKMVSVGPSKRSFKTLSLAAVQTVAQILP